MKGGNRGLGPSRGSAAKRNKYADQSKKSPFVPCAGENGGECEGLCTERPVRRVTNSPSQK